ncbi:MAG: metal-sensitive transcriptional regulator [Actinobacteria bacterium]|nr:metal-sensitive transcriptional regulator [Actinomycetota bacterium]
MDGISTEETPVRAEHERTVLNRLKTARGQLDGVVRMVEDGAYCPDMMKQLAAVQGLLEAASRTVLRNHLETCVADAVRAGRTEEIVDELMETLKFDKRALRPSLSASELDGAPA